LVRFYKSFNAETIVFIQNYFPKMRLRYFIAAWIASKGKVYALEVLAAPVPEIHTHKKYFGLINGGYGWWYRDNWKMIARGGFIKRTLVVSREMSDILCKWFCYNPKKIKVVFHGTDLKRFYPDQAVYEAKRREYNVQPTKKSF